MTAPSAFRVDVGPSRYRDRLVLGGIPVEVPNSVAVKPKRDVDQKKAKGTDGIDVTDNGYAGSPVTIKLTLWDQVSRDWFYQTLLPSIHPRKLGGPKNPLTIRHWKTEAYGIKTIYIPEIDDPEESKGGKMVITLSALAYDPKAKPSKGAGSKPKGQTKAQDSDFTEQPERNFQDDDAAAAAEIGALMDDGEPIDGDVGSLFD